VVYQPYQAGFITRSEKHQLIACQVDVSSRDADSAGIERLYLYYLGDNTFRVLIKAIDSYVMHPAALKLQTLDDHEALELTVSYQIPLQVARIDASASDVVDIYSEIIDGEGALVAVYGLNDVGSEGIALGKSNSTGRVFPLSGIIEHPVDSDGSLYVVVQIPYEFTRSRTTVELQIKVVNP
jgi:hypothetical protein